MALLLQLVVVIRCEQLLYLQQAHNPVKKINIGNLNFAPAGLSNLLHGDTKMRNGSRSGYMCTVHSRGRDARDCAQRVTQLTNVAGDSRKEQDEDRRQVHTWPQACHRCITGFAQARTAQCKPCMHASDIR
jgi:hypothetical protein